MKRLIWVCLLVTGCQGAAVKPSLPQIGSEVVSAARTAPVENTSISKRQMIQKLLLQGEAALAAGRLTEPAEDNAADRFGAVLLIDPGNDRAREGLQMINLSYAEAVREALAKGRLWQARRSLRTMQKHFPSSPINQAVADEVRSAEATVKTARAEVTLKEGEEWIELSSAELGERTAEVKKVLAGVAEKISQTGRSVMIYARNDAEGRWIYKMMNEAVDGFRIRGDIRIANQPALKLMAPL